ncbi:predicted protein [Histoplasma capsulatum H143]|uniref:Uncharacterized protein n=1 Tax=Ajellomyces capsulatus (strain H143) TaxID=544712 RepID=C6HDM7_AJECH|nr:predicted protein [Histoplasma capsulatum H143]
MCGAVLPGTWPTLATVSNFPSPCSHDKGQPRPLRSGPGTWAAGFIPASYLTGKGSATSDKVSFPDPRILHSYISVGWVCFVSPSTAAVTECSKSQICPSVLVPKHRGAWSFSIKHRLGRLEERHPELSPGFPISHSKVLMQAANERFEYPLRPMDISNSLQMLSTSQIEQENKEIILHQAWLTLVETLPPALAKQITRDLIANHLGHQFLQACCRDGGQSGAVIQSSGTKRYPRSAPNLIPFNRMDGSPQPSFGCLSMATEKTLKFSQPAPMVPRYLIHFVRVPPRQKFSSGMSPFILSSSSFSLRKSQQAHASSPKFKPFTSLHKLQWDDELISNNATNKMNSGKCETNHKLYSPTVDRTKLPELKTEQEARSHEHPIANW